MGPLKGVRVIEFAGLGPCPFCAMVLADMGADVLRVDRTVTGAPLFGHAGAGTDILNRGRRSAGFDLKKPQAIESLLRLSERADIVVEGFRPGVMERLGLGPDVVLARNPRLVYGRMTGWGQTGPLAKVAGHDINYIALSGALHSFGSKDGKPIAPANVVGDFGGGGMLLAVGVLAALTEARNSGRGQVVDAAMVEGSALLMTMIYGLRAAGLWSDTRGTNLFDSGAGFYDTYETKDGKYLAVGAFERHFYAKLCDALGIEEPGPDQQLDAEQWPAMKMKFQAVFKTKTRDEWCQLLEHLEVCVSPVLSMAEAPHHPHNKERRSFVEANGMIQPAPAPRFSRTPSAIGRPAPEPGADTDEVLSDWGFSEAEIAGLKADGAIGRQ